MPVGLNELINSHEAAAHSDNELLDHNLSVNLLGTEHVEATTQSRDGQVHTRLMDVLLEHLVDQVTFHGLVGLLSRGHCYCLHLVLVVDLFIKFADRIFSLRQKVCEFLDTSLLVVDLTIKLIQAVIKVRNVRALLSSLNLVLSELVSKGFKIALNISALRSKRLELLVEQFETVKSLLFINGNFGKSFLQFFNDFNTSLSLSVLNIKLVFNKLLIKQDFRLDQVPELAFKDFVRVTAVAVPALFLNVTMVEQILNFDLLLMVVTLLLGKFIF